MSPWPALVLSVAILAASTAEARDRKPETCTSYERATGTMVTECRSPDRKPTHCESYTNITGTSHPECR